MVGESALILVQGFDSLLVACQEAHPGVTAESNAS